MTIAGNLASYFFWGCMAPNSLSPRAIAKALAGITSVHTRLRSLHVLLAIQSLVLSGRPVLEVGFGDGVLLRHLALRSPAVRHEGWEADEAARAKAQSRIMGGRPANISFFTKRFEDYRASGEFGLVYCVDVLEHIADDSGFLRVMARALQPGGFLLVHVPKRRGLQRRFFKSFREHGDPGHVRQEYTREELSCLLEAGGFEILTLRETFGPFGELAFELNSCAWRHGVFDSFMRLVTLPLALPLALGDVVPRLRPWGNSLLALARKPRAGVFP